MLKTIGRSLLNLRIRSKAKLSTVFCIQDSSASIIIATLRLAACSQIELNLCSTLANAVLSLGVNFSPRSTLWSKSRAATPVGLNTAKGIKSGYFAAISIVFLISSLTASKSSSVPPPSLAKSRMVPIFEVPSARILGKQSWIFSPPQKCENTVFLIKPLIGK